jgi:hypothetical protein
MPSALATYVHRVLTCSGDTPTLDLQGRWSGGRVPSHAVLARKLQDYLRWRSAHARHPGVLAAQRRERARLRSERQQRWGRPKPKAA